ncbi:MarR family winged helix-turn-helix transcriptional regulator [Cryobacterium arcticum]|uniref:MarR family transcriptional regulator n=1 Tax=Cryobacterium arcticum TaxID=670052 RepID=A0A1B1BPC1_9MICO|nr:MarR family winged helix-turn-helix transcriptional regulator [Cryobacterium arcticum]ANP74444.1 MarR family transcriptional regulator [Cryobacterium arcticum]
MFPNAPASPIPTDVDRYADLAEVILRAARELSFREHRDSGTISLTPANANVMRYIDRNPGATPSDVADATGVLRSNLSASLRELERLGFVERRSDPADGRGVQLFPTERAARNLAVIRAGWGEHARDALGDLAGVEDTTALIERLTAGLVQARRAHRS